jgi:capsule biosynthesis phosphatase
MKRLIIDLDQTICDSRSGDYENAIPNQQVIEKLREYRETGFAICVYTSRNMRSFEQNIGKINVTTLPLILSWLIKHDVPYDEVVLGKPWCGTDGFYVDDRAIRPSEFVDLHYDEILKLISKGQAN